MVRCYASCKYSRSAPVVIVSVFALWLWAGCLCVYCENVYNTACMDVCAGWDMRTEFSIFVSITEYGYGQVIDLWIRAELSTFMYIEESPLWRFREPWVIEGTLPKFPLSGGMYVINYKWDLKLYELSAYGGSGVPGSPCQSPSGLGAWQSGIRA